MEKSLYLNFLHKMARGEHTPTFEHLALQRVNQQLSEITGNCNNEAKRII